MELLENKILEFKAKYGEKNVYQVDIKLDDEQVESYIIRKPGRKEMEAVAQHSVNKDVTKANNILIANCVLEGNKELIETDGDIYTTLLSNISGLMKTRQVSLKKL
ncbi:MAG: hypothetical protein ACEQSR_01340 [Candidatus Methylacidiphilales bacterium]